MKKPWYIWLSIVSYIYLFYRLSTKIRFQIEPFDLNLWLGFIKIFLLNLFAAMAPAAVLLLIYDSYGSLYTILVCIWIYLYFSFVYATDKLLIWAWQHDLLS